jgi:hypothetical protein
LDKFGRVRLSIENAIIFSGSAAEVANKIDSIILQSNRKTTSNDLAPQVHVLDGLKIVDFSSLTAPEQLSRAIRYELEKVGDQQVTAIIK